MKNKGTPFIVSIIIIVIILLIFGSRMFKNLGPTERAIIFKPLGGGLNKEKIFTPGLHMIAPWNRLIIYDVNEQILEETMDMLDKKGLNIKIDVTVRFAPKIDKIGDLHEQFKGEYINTLVRSELRSVARKILGRYESEEIFSTKRDEVQKAIETETSEVFINNNVVMKSLLLRNIVLPDKIKAAINNKEEEKQIADAKMYQLKRDSIEALRKKIEAEGIATYNRIVNASLTDRILKQKGIDATIKLAESQNSKVVVIGSGKEGMPLILGGN